ncbi:hypothetical protein CL657_00290 [bacterium]|nr:hypothetical protein [bacterium]
MRVLLLGSQLLFLTVLGYWLYLFPTQMLLYWGVGLRIATLMLVIASVLIATCLMIYFRTKTSRIWLRLFVNFGFGACYFASLSTSLIVLLNYMISIADVIKGGLLCVTTSLLISYAIFQGRTIRHKTVHFRSNKITCSKHIVFISDVHLGTQSVAYLGRLIKKIQDANPDCVLIGGDLIDGSHIGLDDLIQFKDLTMPVYFVTGNHDYYLKHSATILANLKEVGITWLDNEVVDMDGIRLIGVNDNQSLKEKEAVVSRYHNNDFYNVAIVHKPSLFDRLTNKPDLMLSGHTHNGQIFPFGWFVRLYFSKPYGLYQSGESYFYVSSGVGTWGNRMRLGSVNEIVHLNLSSI